MRRLTSILVILCMTVLCATASANIMPNEQDPCGDGGCGGTSHDCDCTILDGCPCLAIEQHGVVHYGIPVAPVDSLEEDSNGYWRLLVQWLTSLGDL